MYTPMGLTLPLLAQGWRFSHARMEQFIHIQALFTYLECFRTLRLHDTHSDVYHPVSSTSNPLDDLHYQGREEDVAQLLGQLFEGFDSATSDLDMSRLLDQLFDLALSPEEGCVIFTYISSLIGSSDTEQPYMRQRNDFRALVHAVYITDRFWRERFESFLSLPREIEALQSSEKNEKIFMAFMATFVNTEVMAGILYTSMEETISLLQGWVKSGLFPVLELAVGTLVSPENTFIPMGMIGTSFAESLHAPEVLLIHAGILIDNRII